MSVVFFGEFRERQTWWVRVSEWTFCKLEVWSVLFLVGTTILSSLSILSDSGICLLTGERRKDRSIANLLLFVINYSKLSIANRLLL